jgi:Protein of unknown function (DUF3228)
MSINEFELKLNELFQHDNQLVDGYAPFCKHIFINNIAEVPISYV